MIPDLLEKLLGSKIEAELSRLREGGLPPAEVEALAREAKAAFVDRTRAIKEQAAPLIDAAKGALRGALGVPSREELDRLADRLERAVAALERAQAATPRPPERS